MISSFHRYDVTKSNYNGRITSSSSVGWWVNLLLFAVQYYELKLFSTDQGPKFLFLLNSGRL